MTDRTMDITTFVRGMVWHDVAKPFALGTSKHTPLGYWLLHQAGYDEAWVAFIHGSTGENLPKALKAGGDALPAILLLTNPLDRIAASFYSLLSRRFRRTDFLGRSEDDVEKKYPLFHAWQNPFSRLPNYSEELERTFLIRESYDGAEVPHNRLEQLDKALREKLIAELPPSWDQLIEQEELSRATRADVALEASPDEEADGEALLRTLLPFQAQYPERTYPPANDTTLQEHCRLGGALAFVLYRNLEQARSPWLENAVWLESDGGGDRCLLGLLEDPANAERVCPVIGKDNDWTGVQEIACRNLSARLVRVAFEGHRDLFEHAVRVDDLLGARALTERFIDSFESKLAEVLGAPGLFWASEEDSRQCLLTIHRSQFDLFYLLPPYPTGDGVTTVEEAVHDAYEETLDEIVSELREGLKIDFQRAVNAGVLSFDADAEQALREQLRALSYRVRVLDLEVGPAGQFDAFADFTSAYGTALIDTFGASREYPVVPLGDLPLRAEAKDEVQLPADKTCDVCGNHPLFDPFVDLLDDVEWKSYVQKAVHHFREEPERPCISCIARRMLAHSRVAERTVWLSDMVEWAYARADQPGRVVAAQPKGGPALPSALVSSHQLESDDDFLDLGAAFARCRRDSEGYQLDLFPTISYAADRNGNVVLLALQHTDALDRTYDYAPSIDEIGQLPQAVRYGNRVPETDRERWQASVSLIYHWAKANDPEVAESMLSVRPHLARVLERIRRLRIFYRDLKEALDAEPIRILPLDIDFPTLRLLLPADQLDQALRVLDQVVTESLLSATYFRDQEKRRQAHDLLKLIAPEVLHGAAVLFKQKFPLYLALEAERDVFHQLAVLDRNESPAEEKRLQKTEWYGLRLGFSDLRGSLSEVGPLHAEVTYETLGEVLDLVDRVDRATVLQYAQAAQYVSPELAQAKAIVRTRRLQPLELEHVEALSDEKKMFSPVYFIKRAIRR
jgi:hypothetical protein